ncbi:MAG: hypothetical protein Q8P24_09335 [Desulfobacterales bacterium]|nr:hypothetical protein [Desulfobacterales bacterium]
METKFIDVEGIRTRYLEAGKGEPLVLIHGGHYEFHQEVGARKSKKKK